MSSEKKLNVVFAGTPDIAATALQSLLQSRHNIIGVFTQPDRPAGRGKKLKSSPVKSLAKTHNLPIFQPASFKKEPEYIEQLESLKPDVLIVVAYGLLLPKKVLDIPKHGCLNAHVSLLPKYRGAAPIQRALLAGDIDTGLTIMQMDEGLDTGDILHTCYYTIKNDETSGSLHNALADQSGPALLKTLDDICNDKLSPIKQEDAQANYAHKLTKQEAQIDWHQNAETIERNIRGYQPWPVAHFSLADDTIKVFGATLGESSGKTPGTIISVSKDGIEVATQTVSILLTALQFPNKKAMPIQAILNGKDLSHLIGQIIPS
ncbi:methionyl-tRNA formyltransferase [Francisellaceae bacterium]|nr:methionyl-tRNA formyltransferase [Francisellaceae bacterium]